MTKETPSSLECIDGWTPPKLLRIAHVCAITRCGVTRCVLFAGTKKNRRDHHRKKSPHDGSFGALRRCEIRQTSDFLMADLL